METRKLRPVKALLHAIDVLDALAAHSGADGMSVTELARETKLSKTAVYNILTTLQTRNLVAQNPQTSRYRLGWHLYEIGVSLATRQDVFRLAQPYMEQLVQRTGETILLSILNRTDVIYLDQYESPQSIRFSITPGTRGPLHCTASGKALLAYQPPELVDRLIEAGLTRYTSKTIVDGDQLREELSKVREQGYALARREYVSEHSSVAVPILSYTGGVQAALAIAGPAFRVDAILLDLVPVLLEVGQTLARELGGSAGAGAARLRA